MILEDLLIYGDWLEENDIKNSLYKLFLNLLRIKILVTNEYYCEFHISSTSYFYGDGYGTNFYGKGKGDGDGITKRGEGNGYFISGNGYGCGYRRDFNYSDGNGYGHSFYEGFGDGYSYGCGENRRYGKNGDGKSI